MSRREVIEPTVVEKDPKWGDQERHPAWGMIGVSKVQVGPPGSTLFDSDIYHGHTIVVRISTASRRRDLNRDWLHAEQEFVEVEMSEAQWASFVSSPNSGSGVPCTIRRREDDLLVPGVPHAPRLQESITEVKNAAEKAFANVQEAFATYKEKKSAANLRSLEAALANAPANIAFTADSLTEHTENVVQRARADIEAMVTSKAQQLGLEAGDVETPALTAPDDPEES